MKAVSVSMKSGLRDRNNVPGTQTALAHALEVSMKSGLRDRNNHRFRYQQASEAYS